MGNIEKQYKNLLRKFNSDLDKMKPGDMPPVSSVTCRMMGNILIEENRKIAYSELIGIIQEIHWDGRGSDCGLDAEEILDYIISIGKLFGKEIKREDLLGILSFEVKHE